MLEMLRNVTSAYVQRRKTSATQSLYRMSELSTTTFAPCGVRSLWMSLSTVTEKTSSYFTDALQPGDLPPDDPADAFYLVRVGFVGVASPSGAEKCRLYLSCGGPFRETGGLRGDVQTASC